MVRCVDGPLDTKAFEPRSPRRSFDFDAGDVRDPPTRWTDDREELIDR